MPGGSNRLSPWALFRTELLTEQSTTYAELSIEDYAERRTKQLEF
jgi:hypothetical protein